jgi:predicted permease
LSFGATSAPEEYTMIRFRRKFSRNQLSADLSEEMQQHLEEKIEALIASGMPREEAVHAARRAFGNATLIEQRSREVWMWPLIESIWADIKFVLRQLRKSPGFALTAILTLALGIGVATAMFTIVDGVLLRPLAFPHASQLYVPAAVGAKGVKNEWMSYQDIQQWQNATHDSAEIAFSSGTPEIAETRSGATLISNDTLSANFLQTLGVQPMLGRGFLPEEHLEGRSQVVLLSYPIWRRVFAGNLKILGQVLRIGGVPYSVIGVMPPNFAMPLESGSSSEVFTPIEQTPLLDANAHRGFMPILRLKPGATSASLQAQLSAVQAHIAQTAKPGDEVATHVQLTGLRESMVANVRPALTALEIAVGLVWLIACCNVAGLLLSRLSSRRVEVAVRGALGAGKRRMVLQFLTESLLLSTAGALIGFGLAAFTLVIFRRAMEQNSPQTQNIHLSLTVIVTLVGFTVVTSLLFGVVPAILAARTPIAEMLKSGGPISSGNRGQAGLRNMLLIGEVAISIVLLAGAGLMLRTVYSLRHVPLGFRTDHLVLVNFTVPNWHYKNRNLNAVLWDPLLEYVRHLPGVQLASLSTAMPIGHSIDLQTVMYSPGTNDGFMALIRAASPDQLRVLGIRMFAGRFFSPRDTPTSMPVAVVNRAFVQAYFAGQRAIGESIRFGRVPMQATIIGVLDDIRQEKAATPSQPEIYLPIQQLPSGKPLSLALTGRFMELAVRTQASPEAMIPELRRAIHREHPDLVADNFLTMEQAVGDSFGSQQLAARVIGVFGGLALLITLVGLYGVLNYSVAQRTREIGIRIALGADRRRVTRMILRQAVILLVAGIAAGLALAFWASRFLASFLYGVSIHDPWTLTAVPIVLALCGVTAALIPARRAASINPMVALRGE